MKIGITGGIGSGKTYIVKAFELLGAEVYNCDDEAKSLMVNSVELIVEIKKLMGEQAYINDKINNEYISKIIFNDEKKRTQLNNIVHPAVVEDFKKKTKDNNRVVIIESALLIESGLYKEVDKIITISAADDTRIERVMRRSNMNKETVLNIINTQMTDVEMNKYANYIINNNDKDLVLPQILAIWKEISVN